MRTRLYYPSHTTHRITLEELGGLQQICLEVTLQINIEWGEKQTWDYPGSSTTLEITEVHVDRFESGDGNNEIKINRDTDPDWFELLDQIVWKHVNDNYWQLTDDALTELEDQYDSTASI